MRPAGPVARTTGRGAPGTWAFGSYSGAVRSIDWVDGPAGGAVVIVDQTALPHELRHETITDVAALVAAVRRLAVRGAPALGAVGALGVVLAVDQGERDGWSADRVDAALAALRAARPTAVNLAWGVDRVAARRSEGRDALVAEARAVLDEDVAAHSEIGRRGADLLGELCGAGGGEGGGLRVHTHCNAGALACVDVGTALGVVRALHDRGRLARVYASETRPLLQGSRLTAWELAGLGVDYRLVVDGAGPSLIARGRVDAVVVGADRVAAPVPPVAAATPDGAGIEIEDRGDDVVLAWDGRAVAPAGARAVNPAFDVTPADLVTAVVTERRVVRPAAGERPA